MPETKPILIDSINWSNEEVIAVWGTLKAMLAWVPEIEPKRKPLLSAFEKLNAALDPASRPADQSEVNPEPRRLMEGTNREERRALLRKSS